MRQTLRRVSRIGLFILFLPLCLVLTVTYHFKEIVDSVAGIFGCAWEMSSFVIDPLEIEEERP